MTNHFYQNMSIQEVGRHPGGGFVLRRFGIIVDDQSTLEEVAADKGLPIELLMAALDRAGDVTSAGEFHNNQLMAELQKVFTGYIQDRFHKLLRTELPRLERLLDNVASKHNRSHGEILGSLKTVFMSFKSQIEEHLRIEEKILFPQLYNIVLSTEKSRSSQVEPKSSPLTAINEMRREHELVECAVSEIRALTSDYKCPQQESEEFAALYEGLAGLEKDLYLHARLENDFLWPVRVFDSPPKSASPGEQAASTAVEDVFLCPRTSKRYEYGAAALCDKFWDCVSEAMRKRWDRIDNPPQDKPSS